MINIISKIYLLGYEWIQNAFYESITFYRAIDVHSLMGYIGGYVGLLLGFSVLQIPEILLAAFDKARKFHLDMLDVQQIVTIDQLDVA